MFNVLYYSIWELGYILGFNKDNTFFKVKNHFVMFHWRFNMKFTHWLDIYFTVALFFYLNFIIISVTLIK